jgi:hypothetical protein
MYIYEVKIQLSIKILLKMCKMFIKLQASYTS